MWQIPLRSLHNAIITQIQEITSVALYNECLDLDAQLDISNRD